MEAVIREFVPRVLAMLVGIDVLMFLCGCEKTVTGWILDKLGL